MTVSFQLLVAQDKLLPVIQFNRLTTADGLPTNEIRSNVVRDRQGFAWFGTENGLVRYDGYSCRVYREFTSPANAIVLFFDSRDRFWVGTYSSGISLYDPVLDRFVHFLPREGDSTWLQARHVTAIYEDGSAALWLGCGDPMVVRLDLGAAVNATDADSVYRHARFWRIPYDGFGFVVSGITDWNGKQILACGNMGLFLIDRRTGAVSRPGLRTASGRIIDTSPTTSLFWETQEKLWIGTTSHGLFLCDRTNQSLTLFGRGPSDHGEGDSTQIQTIQGDNKGRLWIASGMGVDIFDMRVRRYLEFLPAGGAPGESYWTRLSFDRCGTVWISTVDDGLYFVTENSLRFPRYALPGRSGKPMNMETINPWPDGWWIGGEGKIFRIRVETREVLKSVDLLHGEKGRLRTRDIWTSYDDGKGNLWFGTFGLGLYRFEPGTSRITNLRFSRKGTWSMGEDVCRSILGARGNSLWIAAYNDGLVQMDTRRNTFSQIQNFPPAGQVIHLMKDNSGRVWISDEFLGVFVMDPSSGNLEHFAHDPADTTSLSDLNTQATFQDADGRIWVGCHDLNLWNPGTKSFTRLSNPAFSDAYGAPPLGVDPQGRLWVRYLGKGVSVLDPKTLHFANFDQTDGAVDPFALATLPDGRIVLVGAGGMNVIEPDGGAGRRPPPPLLISRLSINDSLHVPRAAFPGVSLRLPYDQNTLEFEFAAIDPGEGHLIEYRYRLDGLEDSWVHPGSRRFVRYPGLVPGTYAFRVRAISKYGRWPDQEISVAVSIAPPWWNTSWFRILALLGIIGSVYALYHREVTRLKREKQMQQDFSRQQLTFQEFERKRLAAELHDGLGQDLLIAANEIQESLKEKRRSQKRMKEIAALIYGSVDSAREIASNLHPHHLDRLGFRAAIGSLARTLAKSSSVSIEHSCADVDGLLPKDAELHLYRIIQEALTNAVRHASAKQIRVDVKNAGGRISAVISDNGKGFNPSKLPEREAPDRQNETFRGFGLSSMAERARLIGGTLTIHASHGSGTTVTVTIPHG